MFTFKMATFAVWNIIHLRDKLYENEYELDVLEGYLNLAVVLFGLNHSVTVGILNRMATLHFTNLQIENYLDIADIGL